MLSRKLTHRTSKGLRSILLLLQASILAGATLVPLLSQTAHAITSTQLTPRQATISSAQPSATGVTITFVFDLPGGTQPIQGIKIEFCDQAIGSCTSSNIPSLPSTNGAGNPTINGNWTSATAFAGLALANGDDGGTNNQITITRTQAANETTTGAGCSATFPVIAANCRALSISGITNNSTANLSYYPRLRLYTVNSGFNDTAGTGNQAYFGSVAQSTSQTLTVNAKVQEHLEFCVGTTTVDDNSTSVGANCAAVTGSTVDLGTIDNTAIYRSPVSSPNGNGMNGVAMVKTNASNGTVISYFTQQDTSSGQLKVAGATCISSSSVIDKCFNDPGTAANTFTTISVGTESFGMAIGTLNNQSVAGSYSGENLVGDPNYCNGAHCSDGSGTPSCTGTSCTKFAWNDTTTAANVASSASSAIKVLNNEAIILKFGATASSTTPTGLYSVASTFIATPTF